MNSQIAVQRSTVPITFSKGFESLLLTQQTPHYSLTYDLELHVHRGLGLLEELEDVHDLRHVDEVQKLIAFTNQNLAMGSANFASWQISIAQDLLDEVDLLILTHGDDLLELGLSRVDQGSILVLAASASFMLQTPLVPVEHAVSHFKNRFKTGLESRRLGKKSAVKATS